MFNAPAISTRGPSILLGFARCQVDWHERAGAQNITRITRGTGHDRALFTLTRRIKGGVVKRFH